MNDLVALFKALADPTRLRVLKLLGRGELCVCEIAAALAIEQPRLSFHLRILKQAGIVSVRRRERWILYRLHGVDMLVRLLVLAVHERLPETQARMDRRRLAVFQKSGRSCAGQTGGHHENG